MEELEELIIRIIELDTKEERLELTPVILKKLSEICDELPWASVGKDHSAFQYVLGKHLISLMRQDTLLESSTEQEIRCGERYTFVIRTVEDVILAARVNIWPSSESVFSDPSFCEPIAQEIYENALVLYGKLSELTKEQEE